MAEIDDEDMEACELCGRLVLYESMMQHIDARFCEPRQEEAVAVFASCNQFGKITIIGMKAI